MILDYKSRIYMSKLVFLLYLFYQDVEMGHCEEIADPRLYR